MVDNHTTESQGIRLLRQLFLRGKRIFTMKDAVFAAKLEKIPLNQLRKIVSNLCLQKKLLRLRRGLYVGIGLLPEQTHPFVISSFLVQPSAISHWSALVHHDLTEQLTHAVTATTPKQVVTPSMRDSTFKKRNVKHAWIIDGIRYEYMSIQKKHFFGIEKIWIDEHFQISITDKERTLLDVFLYPKLFGGMGAALGILEDALASIDVDKLIHYAVQYNKKSIAKRLGWALDYFKVPAKKLLPLLKIPIHYYCRLDPESKAIGPCDKRWMIQNNFTRDK